MKRLRLIIQLGYTIITNGYAYGFLNGKIYQGKLKFACVPGLNCYSCPGALASCPMGALQALLNQQGFTVPFAMLGFFFLLGSLLGRTVCGFLCPFGLVQDLLYKLPILKKKKRLPFHSLLKYGKYLVLFLLAGVGSLFLFGGFAKVPAFCKYLCPSGTLFGALPLLGADEMLRSQAGGLFGWKLGVLLFLLLLSIKVYRPFCHCGLCENACPVRLTLEEISGSAQCIRCGECARACPKSCLSFRADLKSNNKSAQNHENQSKQGFAAQGFRKDQS